MMQKTIQQEEIFNQAMFLDAVNNNRTLACRLVQMFLDNYSQYIKDIQTSIDNGDADKLKHSAHAFKGMISYFSISGKELAFSLQEMGDKNNLSHAGKTVDELTELLNTLLMKLNQFMNES
ncbi:MAG: Hpt domain-containing protein [Desulfobacterales bacterium]|nr:Hpt domain-containing protein [Desulfobacterales bacterium]